jgi:hypothetical protein
MVVLEASLAYVLLLHSVCNKNFKFIQSLQEIGGFVVSKQFKIYQLIKYFDDYFINYQISFLSL